MNEPRPPSFSPSDAARICAQVYDLEGRAARLEGYEDQNFSIRSADESYVLKITTDLASRGILELQHGVMSLLAHRSGIRVPEVIADRSGNQIILHEEAPAPPVLVRLLSYLPGDEYARIKERSPSLEGKLGRFLGEMDNALEGFTHPLAHRYLEWDVQFAPEVIRERREYVLDPGDRQRVEQVLARYLATVQPRTGCLRRSIIHNDANDYNVLVDDAANPSEIVGIIDFGDVSHTFRVAEVAIACAYAVQNNEEPLASISRIVSGYHAINPLDDVEIGVLFHLVCTRLVLSVVNVAHDVIDDPGNDHITMHQQSTREALRALMSMDPIEAELVIRGACTLTGRPPDQLVEDRGRVLSPSLSLSYKQPIKVVRGQGAYLYDEEGVRYLDMVNNVCHVGHCHPKVVAAGAQQMAALNTNSRFLHDEIIRYAERLLATLPDPLSTVMLVNSGSEANELALRLARTYTGSEEVVVVDGAYHGNTQGCIDISSYKFNGPGGQGQKPWIHIVDMPDSYRGLHRGRSEETGARYAADAAQVITPLNKPTFICESVQGVGGQIVMPPGYLQGVYQSIREAGGVCIADEVQVGFGRVGASWWGFETQGVVPDIVTLGKPIGNGHPLAACITTREIADAFANGMEYFNTFGGNPVSCAIGSAVLDVMEQEQLMAHAQEIGDFMLSALRNMQQRFPVIGDVRGLGLFLGVELVEDAQTLVPHPALASHIVDFARQHRILLSTEGPLHNVVKMKPPLVFARTDAEMFLGVFEKALVEYPSS